MRFGGRDVARAQLEHLLELTERSNFALRVVPFESDGFAGSGQAVLYAGGPVPQLDTVHLDSMLEPVFLDAEEHLAVYRNMFSKMERRALSARSSRDFITGIIHDL
jgi:hypothetical protein